MNIIYERPKIVFSIIDMESIQRTKELIKQLAYEDQDIKIFDVSEDGFNYEDLFDMFDYLKRICDRATVEEDK